jgi:hypothetical protein
VKGLSPALAAIVSCILVAGVAAMPVSRSYDHGFSLIQKSAWDCDETHCWSQNRPAPSAGSAPVASPGANSDASPSDSQNSGPNHPASPPYSDSGPGPAASAEPSPNTGLGVPARGDPCGRIRAACRRAGFVRGGAAFGIGIAINCIRPIMSGAPGPAARPLPRVDPGTVLACRAAHPHFGMARGPGGMASGRPGDFGPPQGYGGPPGYGPPQGYDQPPGYGPPPAGYSERPRRTEVTLQASCGPDVRLLCAGVPRQNQSITRCLNAHDAQLSPTCKAFLDARAERTGAPPVPSNVPPPRGQPAPAPAQQEGPPPANE